MNRHQEPSHRQGRRTRTHQEAGIKIYLDLFSPRLFTIKFILSSMARVLFAPFIMPLRVHLPPTRKVLARKVLNI